MGYNEVEKYHSTFLNLALPYMAFSEPIKAKTVEYKDKKFTMWDNFKVQGDITLQEFLDYFKKKYDYEIEFVTYGDCAIYLPFSPTDSSLTMNIKDIIEKELEVTLDCDVIELLIGVEDDIDLPSVKYYLK